MLKLPSFISGMLVKRLLAAGAGGLGLIIGQEHASAIAELLMDPHFVEQVFNWVSGGLMIYAAIARENPKTMVDKVQKVEDTVTAYLPKEMDIDPYPGYDYDPFRGWVKEGE